MRNPIEAFQERRDREWWARFDREHRWDRLGKYNAEVSRGIVHTAEWDEAMRREQEAFDRERLEAPR